MKDKVIEQSQNFGQSLEKADSKGMREVCDPDCWFVHIGMSCGLDEERRLLIKRFSSLPKLIFTGRKSENGAIPLSA